MMMVSHCFMKLVINALALPIYIYEVDAPALFHSVVHADAIPMSIWATLTLQPIVMGTLMC